MKPTKFTSKLFLELPPVLAHYVESERHLWLDGSPKRARLNLQDRSGVFTDLEAMAVERRHLIQLLGLERARALRYRTGFEQGRRDATRHLDAYGDNSRLALQAALVFGQLQGRYIAVTKRFEMDLGKGTLLRELELEASVESLLHRMTLADSKEPACWNTAGYLSGHLSEIIGRKVITMEHDCASGEGIYCRFTSKLEGEWGEEADWVREAMTMGSMESELKQRDSLISAAQSAARQAQTKLNAAQRRSAPELLLDGIIGDAESMAPVANRAQQLMAADAPTLIVGEPGCGKEALANAIHRGSTRKSGPFIVIDCDALPRELLAQELFGYDKGAFSGAIRAHRGALARADGGTVYLSELTRLPLDIQADVLRSMQQMRVRPIGAVNAVDTDFRLMAGSSLEPVEAVGRVMLREELHYALNVGRIDLPPLRERREDIARIARRMLEEYAEKYDRPDLRAGAAFTKVIRLGAWPGNVRQLRSAIEHAVLVSEGDELLPGDLPGDVLVSRAAPAQAKLDVETIRAALERTRNNRTEAAELLGVGRTTLWRAMKREGLA